MSNTSSVKLYEGGMKLVKDNLREVYDEELGFSRLYTEKGELLILITSARGCSWWNANPNSPMINLMMDARIVWFFYETYIIPCECGCNGFVRNWKVDEAPMKAFLEGLGLYDIDLGGLPNLAIEAVPPNKKFRVTESNGLECLVIYNDDDWFSS